MDLTGEILVLHADETADGVVTLEFHESWRSDEHGGVGSPVVKRFNENNFAIDCRMSPIVVFVCHSVSRGSQLMLKAFRSDASGSEYLLSCSQVSRFLGRAQARLVIFCVCKGLEIAKYVISNTSVECAVGIRGNAGTPIQWGRLESSRP